MCSDCASDIEETFDPALSEGTRVQFHDGYNSYEGEATDPNTVWVLGAFDHEDGTYRVTSTDEAKTDAYGDPEKTWAPAKDFTVVPFGVGDKVIRVGGIGLVYEVKGINGSEVWVQYPGVPVLNEITQVDNYEKAKEVVTTRDGFKVGDRVVVEAATYAEHKVGSTGVITSVTETWAPRRTSEDGNVLHPFKVEMDDNYGVLYASKVSAYVEPEPVFEVGKRYRSSRGAMQYVVIAEADETSGYVPVWMEYSGEDLRNAVSTIRAGTRSAYEEVK